jgi:hypothetical protein
MFLLTALVTIPIEIILDAGSIERDLGLDGKQHDDSSSVEHAKEEYQDD